MNTMLKFEIWKIVMNHIAVYGLTNMRIRLMDAGRAYLKHMSEARSEEYIFSNSNYKDLLQDLEGGKCAEYIPEFLPISGIDVERNNILININEVVLDEECMADFLIDMDAALADFLPEPAKEINSLNVKGTPEMAVYICLEDEIKEAAEKYREWISGMIRKAIYCEQRNRFYDWIEDSVLDSFYEKAVKETASYAELRDAVEKAVDEYSERTGIN